MTKWIFLYLPLFLFSAHVGNYLEPSLLEKGVFIPDTSFANFRLGAVYSRLFSQKLKEKNKNTKLDLSYHAFTGIFLINLRERVDLYAEVGAIDLDADIYKRNNIFLGTIGGKVAVIRVKNTCLGADVKYLLSDGFSFKNWQISTGLSQKIRFFIPYFGVTFQGTTLKFHGRKFQDRDRIGIVFGASFTSSEYIFVNLEGRFVNEKGFSSTLQMRF